MSPYDAIYIPRDDAIRGAPGRRRLRSRRDRRAGRAAYPIQFVSFADVQKDPGLHFAAGSDASRRELNILIGKNVQAGRLMAGVTFSQPGNWTSWPPHEHAVLAEEAYLYIDMPQPAFGVQLVYADEHEPRARDHRARGGRRADAAGLPSERRGAGPPINFLWMMAATASSKTASSASSTSSPDFAAGGSGLDKGRAR